MTPPQRDAVDDPVSQGVLFISMLFFLCGTAFMTIQSMIPLPYTVVLFTHGIIMGGVALMVYPDVAKALGGISHNLLFYIFLPVLIFEGSYSMSIHALKHVCWQAVILATVGVLMNTVLIAVPTLFFFPDWPWYIVALQGSLLSATDPVAVVSLLKDLGVDKRLAALIDGEAVLNDAASIILFSLLLPAARTRNFSQSVWVMVVKSANLTLTPVLIGPMFGLLQYFWISRSHGELLRACITVSVTYVSYYIADSLMATSGVLTVFFQAVTLSYYYPSLFPGREGNLVYSTWQFLVHVGNTVLFSLVGLILVADVVDTLRPYDGLLIPLLYVAVIGSRFLLLELLLPVLNRFSYKLQQRHVALLTHAGLRGGVAVTLALAVKQADVAEGTIIFKLTCGIVLLTLFVNAPTSRYAVCFLGFKKKEKYRFHQMRFATDYLVQASDRALHSAKRKTTYRNADWIGVQRFMDKHMHHPFHEMTMEDESDEVTLNRLVMSAFKASLWRQRDEKVISERVLRTLMWCITYRLEKGELVDVRRMQMYHLPYEASDASMQESCPRTPSIPLEPHATTNGPRFRDRDKQKGSMDADPVCVLDIPAHIPIDEVEGGPTMEDHTLMVQHLMKRLLPWWVVLAERCLFKSGSFLSIHRRVQEDAFMALLAIARCLTDVSHVQGQYMQSNMQVVHMERWRREQLHYVHTAIHFFYEQFPEATSTVASRRVVLSAAECMSSAVNALRERHSFGVKETEPLEGMIRYIHDNVSRHISGDTLRKQDDLVVQAVTATTLGKALNEEEVRAVCAMGLVQHWLEGDLITLQQNAMLIATFGSLHAVHGPWTTVCEQDEVVSFSDTVGLDGLLLPGELQRARPRQWRVVSSKATTLILSLNAIKPLLLERSLRAVRALWRAAAVEVLYSIFRARFILFANEEENHREELISFIMKGTPLIGPRDCAKFDWTTQFHLCFYLRGCDTAGLFGSHTPPCYVSAMYASQLEWADPYVVLYALPVTTGENGYIPWDTTHAQLAGPLSGSRPTSRWTNTDLRSRHEDEDAPVNGGQEEELTEMAPVGLAGRSTDMAPVFPPAHRISGSHTSDRVKNGNREGRPRAVDAVGHTVSPCTTSTHSVVTYILNHFLRGELPDDVKVYLSSIQDSAEGEMPYDVHSPTTIARENTLFYTSAPRLVYSSTAVCVLQSVPDFVTPVPYINQRMGQYASVLEQLCMAAFRFICLPTDSVNIHHARRTSKMALEFLLTFCMELTLLRRAMTILLVKHVTLEGADELQRMLHGEEVDQLDAAFQCRVCTWSRSAQQTRTFQLREMITEMNSFANRRFNGISRILHVMASWEPLLLTVETVEGLQKILCEGDADGEER